MIVLACGECGIASIGQVSTSLNSCDYVCMVTIICVIMCMCSFGTLESTYGGSNTPREL